MKRFLLISFVAACSLLFCGCNYNRNIEQIARAESYIADSAQLSLRILDSVNRRSLILPKHMAHFSLLYAEAQAKCRCDALDSATVSCAYNYFKHNGNPTQKLHANYLMGYYYQQRGDNSGAMYYYTCGEEFVEQCDNDFLCGRLYSFMGLLYTKYYDYPNALIANKKACDYYSKTRYDLHKIFAKWSIARVLLCQNDYENSRLLLEECIRWVIETRPKFDCLPIINTYINYLLITDNYSVLSEFIEDVYSCNCDNDNSVVINVARALLSANVQDKTLFEKYINQGLNSAKTESEKLYVNYWSSIAYYFLNDNIRALANFREYNSHNTQVRDSLSSRPLLSSIVQYHKQSLELTEAKVEQSRLLIYILVSAVVFGVVVVYLLYRNHYQCRIFELRENLARTLQHRKLLEAQCESKDKIIREKSQALVELYNDKFEFINQIGDAVFSMPFNTQRNEVVMKKVDKLIGEFICENSIKLEKFVNDMHDNIIDKIREQIPDLPNNALMLMCYIYAGFNTGAICFFMGLNNKGALYTRKNRVIKIINESNAKDKEYFLKLLR